MGKSILYLNVCSESKIDKRRGTLYDGDSFKRVVALADNEDISPGRFFMIFGMNLSKMPQCVMGKTEIKWMVQPYRQT